MKKLLAVLLVCCMMLFLVGCGTEYEDTNGEDDYTLQTITDENIIRRDIGASGLSYEELNLGGLESKEYSSKNFNGVEQIYLTGFIGKSDVFVYVGNLNVKSGNFRMVVINNDEIIYEFEDGTFNEEVYFEDLEGDFSIHVAGESANVKFDVSVY